MAKKNKLPLERVYEALVYGYILIATLMLIVIAIVLAVTAVYQMAGAIYAFDMVDAALNAIGLLIIGFAVVETAKFIAEEEVFRDRELRSSIESRRSVTKFITIIVIAISLEALVMIFKSNQDEIRAALYPAILFSSAMFALIALGVYQYLSSRIEPASREEMEEAERGYDA
ncbi:MAG: hypothetical protein K5872_02020 [Rhizobiaceae bacterium]|nr:hypothetical protein [Rhizobiaceae bacterium]MCV0404986.1 hypothetical protein [Rhizobiaceae bacterium]